MSISQKIRQYSEYQTTISSDKGTFIFLTSTEHDPELSLQIYYDTLTVQAQGPDSQYFILDVDELPKVRDELEATELPLIVQFRNGQLVERE